MNKFIPLSVPNLCGNELHYTSDAITSEWVSTGGSYIDQFECAVAGYVHVQGAVACQSGTAALHLALLVNGVGVDDEVFVPTLTFVAAVNPVRYVGADPIFMDCDDSLCMDMDKLQRFIDTRCTFDGEKLINNRTRKHIKAVVIVHVFGNIADMDTLMQIASRYNLIVVEDATEALGSYIKSGKYAGCFAGTIGNIGAFSFNGNKIITTGGGGMLVSNDANLLRKAKHLSTQAKADELYFDHDEIGYNYRMTNIQATLGLAQMENLEQFIETKTANYAFYQSQGVALLPFRQDIRPNYWFYSHLSDRRDELIQHLSANQIQSRPVWKLIHQLKPYITCESFEIEKALHYWNKIVNLPCSTNLVTDDVQRVCAVVKEFEVTR